MKIGDAHGRFLHRGGQRRARPAARRSPAAGATLLALAALAPRAGWAICPGTSLVLHQSSYLFGAGSGTDARLTFEVRRSGEAHCDYYVTFGYGEASSWSSRALRNGTSTYPVQLYKDEAPQFALVLRDQPDASSAEHVISGTLPGGGGDTSRVHSYRAKLLLPSGYGSHPAHVRFGTYSERFTVRLYGGPVGGGPKEVIDQASVTFTYRVPRMVDLSLVPTGEPFDPSSLSRALQLGTLAAGLSRSVDVALLYNAGYCLRFSSANGGRLRHSRLASYIPYQVRVGGALVSLASSATAPVEVSRGYGVSPASAARIPVTVGIGALGPAMAGDYSDTITVTVTSTE